MAVHIQDSIIDRSSIYHKKWLEKIIKNPCVLNNNSNIEELQNNKSQKEYHKTLSLHRRNYNRRKKY